MSLSRIFVHIYCVCLCLGSPCSPFNGTPHKRETEQESNINRICTRKQFVCLFGKPAINYHRTVGQTSNTQTNTQINKGILQIYGPAIAYKLGARQTDKTDKPTNK